MVVEFGNNKQHNCEPNHLGHACGTAACHCHDKDAKTTTVLEDIANPEISLEEALALGLGAASVAWEGGTKGAFKSDYVLKVHELLLERIKYEADFVVADEELKDVTVHRDAKDGKFVTEVEAKANPDTTVEEKV